MMKKGCFPQLLNIKQNRLSKHRFETLLWEPLSGLFLSFETLIMQGLQVNKIAIDDNDTLQQRRWIRKI